MKQIIQNYRSGRLSLGEAPAPGVRSGGILVATRASLVSAGTEKMLIDLARASLAGKAMARPDLVRQVIDKARREGIIGTIEKVMAKLDTPIPLGYSLAGRVVEVGRDVEGVLVDDRVACAGAGYANHAEYNFVPKHLCVKVPDVVDDESASFVTLGAIALQGVRQAAPTLGERIAVIGLGLLGLLTVQLLKANGCRVIGFDPNEARCVLARSLGADIACSTGLEAATDTFTDHHGADAVIVTAATKSDEPVNTAARIARRKGRVVLVGMVGMKLDREPFYKKELDLRLSMSYGPGRYDPAYEEGGQDYPFAYVRWTEQRNMQAFLELVAAGSVTPKALITHRFQIRDALDAYALLDGSEPFLGIVLDYPEDTASLPTRRVTTSYGSARKHAAKGRIGFIGAGNFATAVLIPAFRKVHDVELTGLATRTSISAAETARKFGFGYATTDHREVLNDPDTDIVVVATRHDTHAPLVAEALAAGKHVFCEKPLAIDRAGLDQVLEAAGQSPGLLTVGFNRRFAPMIDRARRALEPRSGPLVMLYRVNAGAIPADSWIAGGEGGGRIIGEVCHFIDTLCYVSGSLPVEVHAMAARDQPDAVSILLRLADGSTATIVYSSLGDPAVPKEYLEVFAAGRVVQMNDFAHLQVTADGRRTTAKGVQDKGQAALVAAFMSAVRGYAPVPIPLNALIATTEATLAAEQTARNGGTVLLNQISKRNPASIKDNKIGRFK